MPEPAPAVTGLFEAHLPVTDLERSVSFYGDVLGLELAHRNRDGGGAFFWLGTARRSVVGLWATGRWPNRLELHLALATPLEEVLRAPAVLRGHGVTPLDFHGDETDAPSVIAWLPAAALYLRDPDGHLLEYLALLDDEPAPDRGIVSWSEWPN